MKCCVVRDTYLIHFVVEIV